jgi:hypothetical protein
MRPVVWLRLLAVVLVAAAVTVAVVPLMVLLDLVRGGNGYGLCPDGLVGCRTRYTAGPELIAGLTVALLLIVAAIRALMRAVRRQRSDEFQVAASKERTAR